MNNSERLHNQGKEQQNKSPELQLSMQLRSNCENLLREKGKNSFSFGRLFCRTFFYISADMLDGRDGSVEKVIYRRVVLKQNNSNEQNMYLVACTGTNPKKAKFVEVYNLSEPKSNGKRILLSEPWLRLEKNKEAVFVKVKEPIDLIVQVKHADVQELLDYQNLINESSPVEHK